MQSIVNFCRASQTHQDDPSEAITPKSVQRAGYTPIPTYPRSRAIASCWKVGYGIDVAAGLQADGTWLHLLDLDSHTPEQDATAQLDRIRRRLGPDLYGRLAIRLSRSGRGYHIVYRTAIPHSEYAYIKVFDPLQPDRHIGELIGPGMRVTLTGEWIQHGPEAIPLLTTSELDRLRAAIHTPALYAPQNAPGSPQSQPGDHTARKDRMAEGLSLIAGWEQVTDVQQRLETLSQRFEKVEQRLREMRRTPRNRSDAYSQLVQSLMYHAAGLGRDLYERCQVVAAIAIHVGAAGKERERTYKIINDTATLIARIIHGDQFLNNPDLHFGIPRWVNATQIPVPPSLSTQPQSAERKPHPHARDRQKNIKKLSRYFRKLPIDQYGKRHTCLKDLTELLGVKRRAVQTYLEELRERGAIRSGQDGGNGPLYIVILDPPKPTKNRCKHAGFTTDEPQATTDNHSDRSARQKAESSALMPENPSEDHVCIEELGAPKACAPSAALLAPGPLASASALVDEQAELVSAGFEPLAGDQLDDWPAISLVLADEMAGGLPPPDELVCGVGIAGPAGAFAIVGGAAYVPSGAEPWYARICAAVEPAASEQADDQAEIAQLVASFDAGDLAELDGFAGQADESGANYERAADQIASAPDRPRRRRRKRKDPIRERLDKRRQEIERWQRMDIAELEIERCKLAGASQDCERSAQQRETLAQKLPQIDVEIGRKRSAGIQAMYQAANVSSAPPPAVEQAAPAPGVVRRVWRSPFVPFDTPTGSLPPREEQPHTHPIAELGTNPESMRAAHEYCERIMARLRAQGEA